MARFAINFVREETGAGMIEYALLLALIALALIAVTSFLAYGTWALYASVGNELINAIGPGDGNGGGPPPHAGTTGPPPYAGTTGPPPHAGGERP